jgi:monoamine oxidase
MKLQNAKLILIGVLTFSISLIIISQVPAGVSFAQQQTAEAAEYLDSVSETEAIATGLEELSLILNNANLARYCLDAKRFSWAKESYIGGGYAHVPAGAANARLQLAKPEGNIFFAGEATAHYSNPQTVHGAIESGWRAAREILEVLET